MSISSDTHVRNGWTRDPDGIFRKDGCPAAQVHIDGSVIVGVIGEDIVSSYVTSGVWPSKISAVMADVERHLPTPANV